MIRKPLLTLFLCLSFPAVWAANSGCGTADDLCQGKLIAPPSLEPSQTLPRIQSPDASALAPMPSSDNSSFIKGGPESRQALMKNHDDDLFGGPHKTEAVTDPFGPDSGQRLHIAPE